MYIKVKYFNKYSSLKFYLWIDILKQRVLFARSKTLLEIRVIHFGIKPRGIKNPSDLSDPSFSEGKRVNEAERKTDRRRMNASSQRVKGYSFLILFYEVDRRSNPMKGGGTKGVHFPKEY